MGPRSVYTQDQLCLSWVYSAGPVRAPNAALGSEGRAVKKDRSANDGHVLCLQLRTFRVTSAGVQRGRGWIVGERSDKGQEACGNSVGGVFPPHVTS